MSIITNVIKTILRVEGSQEAEGAINRFGRAQTRLSNSSTGAGRTFAAQSSGLGGLVGAYAGAAATTFALSAAFDALSKSAISAQTIAGVSTLAANMGQDGSKIISKIKDITNSQLTLADTAEHINLALSAGFSTAQIEGLATVASKASKALGRDLADSMSRVTKGSAKMQTELLDELGIYTRIGPATSAYAASIGKSTSKLTDYERRQAFVNAVIAEGEKKFSSISTTIPTAAAKLAGFSTKISDMALQFGNLLANYVAPLADFLTNNASAAFAAFGLILSLVASKGVGALETVFQDMTKSINNAGIKAEGFIRSVLGIGRATKEASATVHSLDTSMLKLSDSERLQLSNLQKVAEKRNLGNAELASAIGLVEKSKTAIQTESASRTATIATLKDEITAKTTLKQAAQANFDVQKQTVATLVTQNAATSDIASAEAARASAQGKLGAAVRALNAVQKTNQAQIIANTAEVAKYTEELVKHDETVSKLQGAKGIRGAIASFATGATKLTTTVMSGFTNTITGIVNGASKLMFISSIFVMIGTSIAEATGQGAEFSAYLKTIGETIKTYFGGAKKLDAANVFQGINAKSITDLEAVDSKLKAIDKFTFTEKVYGVTVKVDKTKEELSNEVSSLLADSVAGPKTLGQAMLSGKAIGSAAVGGIIGAIGGGIVGATFGPEAIPAGIAIGKYLGAGIGLGLGTIWDYLTVDDNVPTEVSTKIKKEFSSMLTSVSPDTQDKLVGVIAKIQDKYGAAAMIDPNAAAAMKLQLDLVAASAKYMENVQAISELMIATGQSADQVAKVFTFDTAKSQIDYIHKAFLDISGKKLSFSFIDAQSPEIKKILDMSSGQYSSKENTPQILSSLKATINAPSTALKFDDAGVQKVLAIIHNAKDIMSSSKVSMEEALKVVTVDYAPEIIQSLTKAGISIESLSNIVKSSIVDESKVLATAIGDFNAFGEQASRLGNVQATLTNSIADGSITLEAYSQSLGNARNSLIETVRTQASSRDSINTLVDAYNQLNATGEVDRAAALLPIIQNMKVEYGVVSETLKIQRAINKELAGQEGHVRSQVEIYDFLNSFKKNPQNKLNIELDFVTAGAKPEEKLKKTLTYLETFKNIQMDTFHISSQTASEYDTMAKSLGALDLLPSDISKIMDTKSIGEAQKQIQDLGLGLTTEILKLPSGIDKLVVTSTNGAHAIFTPMIDGAGKVLGIINATTDAQKQLVEQAIQELPGYIDKSMQEYTTTIKTAEIELSKLTNLKQTSKIKFEADTSSITESLKAAYASQALTAANSKFDIAKASNHNDLAAAGKAVSDAQIGVYNQQVTAIKSELEQKSKQIDQEHNNKLDEIRLENDAQQQKLTDDKATVNGLLAVAQQHGAILVAAGNTIGQTLTTVMNALTDSISKATGKTIAPFTFKPIEMDPEFLKLLSSASDKVAEFNTKNAAASAALTNLANGKAALADQEHSQQITLANYDTYSKLAILQSNTYNDANKSLADIVAKEQARTKQLTDQLAIDKQQYAVELTIAQNDLASKKADIAQAAMARELELSNILVDNDQKRLDLAIQQADFVGEALKSSQSHTKVSAKGKVTGKGPKESFTPTALQDQVAKFVTPTIQQLVVSLNDASVTAAATKLGNAIKNAKPKEVKSATAELELAAQTVILNKRKTLFDQETVMMGNDLANKELANFKAQEVLKQQSAIDEAKFKAEDSAILARQTIALQEVTNIDNFVIGVNAFGAAIDLFLNGLRKIPFMGGMIPAGKYTPAKVDTSAAYAAVMHGTEAERAANTAASTASSDQNKLKAQSLQTEMGDLTKQYSDLIAKRAAQKEGLSIDDNAKLSNIADKIFNLGAAADSGSGTIATLTGRLADFQSSVESSVESAFMGLNDLIVNGNGSIREIIGGLFKSIEEEVYKETIAKPLANIVSNWVTGAFKSAFQNKDIMNSPLNGVVGSAVGATKEGLTKNTMGDNAVGLGTKAFEGLGKKVSNAMGSASKAINSAANAGSKVLQGTGQVLAGTTQTTTATVAAANTAGASTLMSSLGPILAVLGVIALLVGIFGGHKKKSSSSVLDSTGTGFTSIASSAVPAALPTPSAMMGSVPQMASGGLRDRAPTLLEPGEFVIRKPMVAKIGTSALESMNATGKAPGAAPVINIKNEGTAKDATASAPRFDGEKYVIDIVMRDLSNNGPIRRTLRGGAI